MNKKEKIAKLQALKESFVATQKKLASAKMIEESLRATNIGVLLEAELEQAEVILAAKDFATKLQKMAEELAKMQADSIPLGDNMKEVIGPDAAQDFENTVTQAIQAGLQAVRGAKDQISSSIQRVEGGTPESDTFSSDMGASDPLAGDTGADLGGETGGDELGGDDIEDVFGGAEANAGPADEPLGRGFKESSYKEIGAKLLMTESLDSLVDWLFEDVAATMAPAQFPKFASQIAMKGAQDGERLAGWIGKRKYGPGIGAQLSSPLADMEDDILDEGKSYKRDDEEEVDVKGKKKADAEKKERAKAKRTVEEAVRLIIERNIAKTGKGFAAKAIAEAQGMFPMLESSNESIAEAFEAEFGMSPQAYSIKKAKLVREATTLSTQDKQKAAGVVSKIAGEMSTDKNLGNKSVQQAMSKMDSNERATAQKIINNAKSKGSDVKKVDDLVTATKGEIDEAWRDGASSSNHGAAKAARVAKNNANNYRTKANAVKDNPYEYNRLMEQYFKNMASYVKNAYSANLYGNREEAQKDYKEYIASAKECAAKTKPSAGQIEENINAANWPVNSMGQYKGEPFQTDHNKLKANKTSSDNGQVSSSPKSADEPKDSTPWDNKGKSESPKTSDGVTTSTKPAPKSKEGAKSESEGSEEQKD